MNRILSSLALAASLILPALALPTAIQAADSHCYELRTYHTHPGKLAALHARFRDHTVQLFEKHGMTNIGYWVPVENEGQVLKYLMAYPSREARDKSWKAFLKDPEWKAAYAKSTENGKLVKKVDSQFLTATDYSPVIEPRRADTDRLFELRIYTTQPGKLKDLDARFRDHTVKLFEEHGITNFGYWHLDAGQKGADHTLVYLLAHQDRAARDAGFKAFGQDPRWQQARKASEENGRLLIPKGVNATFLMPMDYSPTR